MISTSPLILASASPRRTQLLTEAGRDHEVAPAHIEEIIDPRLAPAQNAMAIARAKADTVARRFPERLVIGADTMVVLDGEIIGKPVDEEDARAILHRLAGREHFVITGVAFRWLENRLDHTLQETSRVRLRKPPAAEIEKYVASGEPMDKAGGYAIQGGAASWIASYEGSYTNIVGLPMEKVSATLKAIGQGADLSMALDS